MLWYQGDEDEEEDLMFSPALLARRASESWINTPPIEVRWNYDEISRGIDPSLNKSRDDFIASILMLLKTKIKSICSSIN